MLRGSITRAGLPLPCHSSLLVLTFCQKVQHCGSRKSKLNRENLSEPCLAYKSRLGAEKYDSVVNHERFKMYRN